MPATRLQHGIFLPPFDALAEPSTLIDLAVTAETAGWDGFFLWDHITYRPPVTAVADPWTLLSAVATRTETIRIGPLVTPLPRRRPVVVARQTATLDRLSRGRLTLGVGIGGDTSREFSATGEQTDAKLRGAMLDESLEVITAAWTGEPVQHTGAHYTVAGLTFRPKPVQRPRPPVWVAGRFGNAAPLRRAARWDGVFPIDLSAPADLAEVVATVHANGGRTSDGFDVVAEGAPGADPSPWRDAGATWWLVSFGVRDLDAHRIRDVIAGGPPG